MRVTRTSRPTLRTTKPLSATQASASLPGCSLTTSLIGFVASLIGCPRSERYCERTARIADLWSWRNRQFCRDEELGEMKTRFSCCASVWNSLPSSVVYDMVLLAFSQAARARKRWMW